LYNSIQIQTIQEAKDSFSAIPYYGFHKNSVPMKAIINQALF